MVRAAQSPLLLPLLTASLLFIGPVSVRADSELPGAPKALTTVDFERHVMGLFGRMGCNAGSCHGSFQGKGGFRLSLFGYAPDKDYLAVTRDNFGRRINRGDPERSLLLLKATGQIEHGGGVRFRKGSWQYDILRRWIVDGMPWTPGSGDVTAVTITPAELAFKKPKESVTLRVKARFSDGSEADITPFCDFRTNDDAVADVATGGTVRSLQAGSTAIIVSYRGNVLPVRVMVPVELPAGFRYPQVPANNYIDQEVFARLKLLNMVPSNLSSDEEFLRRVTIDTIGQLPTPEEVRAFLRGSIAGQAGEEDRRIAGPPAARGAVGDQAVRHHRQRHAVAGESQPAAGQAQPDVARLVPQARRGQRPV